MTAAEAKAVLAKERQARVEACGAAVRAVLEEHNCVLAAIPKLVPTGGAWVMSADAVIQPKEG